MNGSIAKLAVPGTNENMLMTVIATLSPADEVAAVGLALKGASSATAKIATKGPEALTTVGRWMSKTEAKNMTNSGMVQESHSGLTHVANPASASTFAKQAKPGSVYTEFDVPSSSLRPSGTGVSSIPGPNAPVKPAPSMPAAQNIKILDEKP